MQTNPNCKCGVPSELQTVKKAGDNTGKQFYSCSRRRDDVNNCGFFEWVGGSARTTTGFQPASSIPAPAGQLAVLGHQIQMLMKRVDVLEDQFHSWHSVQPASMDH